MGGRYVVSIGSHILRKVYHLLISVHCSLGSFMRHFLFELLQELWSLNLP
jgi:hypothetical protein